MGVWVVLGERFHYILNPPRMSGRSVSEPHFPFASLRRHLPVFLSPVTDNMPFLSQRKETLVQKKYVSDARVDLGTTGIGSGHY